ncbi:hypothetical protein HMPREF9477_01924 [Lachnospiraceae bacterium 2_1_46FAA]|nr:hypothetical protein HMPREF9477_01924 [Lachnospiraceae bacterium 2_1_46FAA]
MFCPNCGTKCNDDDLFCGECGTSLAEYREEETDSAAAVKEADEQFERIVEMPEKKPKGSKINFLLIGEILVMVAVLVGIYFSLDKKYSAETTALEYWKAKSDCEWSKVYDYYSFGNEKELSKQMYVNAHSQDNETIKYQSVTAKKNGGQKDSDSVTCGITYRESGSGKEEYETVSLVKGEKKFLFWNEWNVIPTDEVVDDWSLTVPENATVKLNGEEIKESKSSGREGMKKVTAPSLFQGQYQLEVSEEGMEPYRDIIQIDSNTLGERIELVPKEEEKEKLAEQFGKDLEKILTAAVSKEDFSKMKEIFSEEAMKRSFVKSSYEDLYRIMDTEGVVIRSFNIADVKLTLNNYYENKLTFDVSMKIKTTYKRFWSEQMETEEKENSGTVTYVKEEDGWKLQSLPISYYDLIY